LRKLQLHTHQLFASYGVTKLIMSEIIAGKYEILEEIGRGGMGCVYKAYQKNLERYVAIKILSENLAEDPEFRERFQREASIVARLSHPNIVAVYDFERYKNTICIIMEYVDGSSLQRLVEEHALSERDVLLIGAQIARALHYAHQNNVIHRDVKPDNILVTPSKVAKITDFGIARFREAKFRTQPGINMGTPRFMSPEHITGGELDGRSDLYSLGVCLYYALTGQPPFDGDTPISVATCHLYQAPRPIRELNPSVSPLTESIVLRALEKNREARWPNGESMARALTEAATALGPIVIGSLNTEIPQDPTRPVSVLSPSTPSQPPESAGDSFRTPTGLKRLIEPTPVPQANGNSTESLENLASQRPPTRSWTEEPKGLSLVWNWLRERWGIASAVLLVLAAFAFALWYQGRYQLGTSLAQEQGKGTPAPTGAGAASPRTEYDQLVAATQRMLAEGRAKQAIEQIQAFKEKYPDYEPQRVDNLIDRITAGLPLSEIELLAKRRDQKGKRFFNDPTRLPLARAYLRAARDLYVGQQRSYTQGEGFLRLLDQGASGTLAMNSNPAAAAQAFARARFKLESSDPEERSAAEKDLMDAVCSAPDNYDYWFELANFYKSEGMLDDARVLLRYVEETAPQTSEAYKRATRELRSLGQ
jgi:serine/threonine protein kinase